jgi:hypothetical protein
MKTKYQQALLAAALAPGMCGCATQQLAQDSLADTRPRNPLSRSSVSCTFG